MARKRSEDPGPLQAQTPAPAPPSSADIIPEGDYAGMTYDEVMALTSEGLDKVYENLSIDGVCMMHDLKLAEILLIVEHYQGPDEAHKKALNFGQTLMPYLTPPKPKVEQSFGQLRNMIRHNGGPPLDEEE